MYWSTTVFKVQSFTPTLEDALRNWERHIKESHPQVKEVRSYTRFGGTTVIWQEGFLNFHDYQDLIGAVDATCESVMGAVFQHEIPGGRESGIWSDALKA